MDTRSDLFQRDDDSLEKSDFDIWINIRNRNPGEQISPNSSGVYRSMWNAFCVWAMTQNVKWSSLQAEDVRRFLAYRGKELGREISAQQARRYYWLVTVVSTARDMDVGVKLKAACDEIITKDPTLCYALARNKRRLPQTLLNNELKALFDYLSRQTRSQEWRRRRDAAMLATIMGAGLKPSETLYLPLAAIIREGVPPHRIVKLSICGNGNNSARETPIADWAAMILEDWLDKRRGLNFSGFLVFPADEECNAVSKATLIRQFGKMATEAGITLRRGGSHMLRHTWAVRQLRNESSLDDIRHWLGLETVAAVLPYVKIVSKVHNEVI